MKKKVGFVMKKCEEFMVGKEKWKSCDPSVAGMELLWFKKKVMSKYTKGHYTFDGRHLYYKKGSDDCWSLRITCMDEKNEYIGVLLADLWYMPVDEQRRWVKYQEKESFESGWLEKRIHRPFDSSPVW